MSKKTDLLGDLKHVSAQLGGSHLTRQARASTINTFVVAMEKAGYGIRSASQIGGRHLRAFAASQEHLSDRTRANQMSHVRAILRYVGKSALANNPEFSNKALGIGKGSRTGTKVAMPEGTLQAFQDRMNASGRKGVGIAMAMQYLLGLREMEAIRGGQADTLSRWEKELTEKGQIRVVEGTKGGRPRDVHPVHIERALAVIREARELLRQQGGGFLIRCADGSPTANLKQAQNIYRNICHREGVQSHSARYAFARDRIEAYRAAGYSEREARSSTSLDLGHGDGRGRYVASVYARGD